MEDEELSGDDDYGDYGDYDYDYAYAYDYDAVYYN